MRATTSGTPDTRDRLLGWYRILSVVFVVGLLLFLGARIGLLRADRQSEASRLFLTLRAHARAAMDGYEAGDDTALPATLGELARGGQNLLLLAIHEKDRTVYYFYARTTSIFYTPPQPTSDMLVVPAYRAPRLTTTRQESTLELRSTGRTITVEALYRTLTPDDVHRVGSEALYILLAYLIATLTVLLVSAALGQRAAPDTRREHAVQDKPLQASRPPATPRPAPTPPPTAAPAMDTPPPAIVTAPPPLVPEDAEPVLTIDDLEPPLPSPPSAATPEPVEPQETAQAPRGLPPRFGAMYREDTGLVHRELLEPRLRSEIERAAASDQDVVLALIALDNAKALNRPEAVTAVVAQRVRETFPFRDLLFHYEEGFAVIVPDTNLDRALLRLEDFRSAVASTPIEGQYVTVSVGIGARNGRLISDEILMREAGQSLAKAIHDGRNQIVAFRADPDKFRRVLAK